MVGRRRWDILSPGRVVSVYFLCPVNEGDLHEVARSLQ